MKKLLVLAFLLLVVSCEKNDLNDVLPDVIVDVVIDLNLPQYINLQTPSGWAYTNGGLKGIVIQNIKRCLIDIGYKLSNLNNEFDSELKRHIYDFQKNFCRANSSALCFLNPSSLLYFHVPHL